jgi:hypothetical protein
VEGAVVVGGRPFSGEIIDRIQSRIAACPDMTRAALAREVCQWLDWKRPNGKWHDMSCRVAMLKLHRRGVIPLPAPRRQIGARCTRAAGRDRAPPPTVRCSVEDVQALRLVPVSRATPELSALWNDLVARYHYLGYQPLVGAQQRYLIGSADGWLGAVGFSAAAWQVAARDRWIGWSAAARCAHLPLVVCNSRLLILPGVQVANLASKVLSLCAKRVPADWQATYGYEPVLVETYVDRERFAGTCYRAANWIWVGATQGRGRQDRGHRGAQGVKDIYLCPLRPTWRQGLCAPPDGVAAAPVPRPPADWAEEEFGAAVVGDARLQARLLTVGRDFYARPQANLPQACGSRAKTKAAYRFLDQSKVTMKQVLASHYQATRQRLAQERVVLAVQDTTSLNYTMHPATDGLGPIGTEVNGPQGLLVHDTMAFSTTGLALGLVDVQVWARDPAAFGKRAKRYELPIEQKESAKWLRSFEAAAAVQAQLPETTVVSVGDREADVYELFVLAQSRPHGPKLLVRAERDRLVREGQQRLWAAVEGQTVAGYQHVRIPPRPGRLARVAQLAIRFASVVLCAPRHKPRLGPVRVWMVLAREVDAPAGVKPLEWMLLTTLEVDTLEHAAEKLAWYAQRWQIEVYHRTLKSGCRIEQRQLATAHRLENCLAIDMVVAWRLVHLTKLGRDVPEVPCTIYFEDYQWQALYGFIHKTAPPGTPPSLREAIRMVASLGGFLGRKGDGEPGTQTLWLGLQRLDDIASGWHAYSQIFSQRGKPP